MQRGALVFCHGEDRHYEALFRANPKICPLKGMVYTVGHVFRDCPDCGEPHLLLEEFVSPFVNGWPVAWFRPCREHDFGLFLARIFGSNSERPVTG